MQNIKRYDHFPSIQPFVAQLGRVLCDPRTRSSIFLAISCAMSSGLRALQSPFLHRRRYFLLYLFVARNRHSKFGAVLFIGLYFYTKISSKKLKNSCGLIVYYKLRLLWSIPRVWPFRRNSVWFSYIKLKVIVRKLFRILSDKPYSWSRPP